MLGCSDSRVAPEILFDQTVGDLFVVRTAGQVADRAVVGTVEFAVKELSVPLLVVLGHERCGAVTAAVAAHDSGESPDGDLGYLVDQIEPVVDEAPGDRVDRAVRKNVARVVAQLGAVPAVAEGVKAGKVRVVGARYDLDNGRLELLKLRGTVGAGAADQRPIDGPSEGEPVSALAGGRALDWKQDRVRSTRSCLRTRRGSARGAMPMSAVGVGSQRSDQFGGQ